MYWLFPLVFESILLIIFFIILIKQGPRAGVKILAAIFLIVVFFSFNAISRAVYWSSIPIGPPPIYFDEGYYDGLVVRSNDNFLAILHSYFLLLLSISYTLTNFREYRSSKEI